MTDTPIVETVSDTALETVSDTAYQTDESVKPHVCQLCNISRRA
jgi:hypothetical protein